MRFGDEMRFFNSFGYVIELRGKIWLQKLEMINEWMIN